MIELTYVFLGLGGQRYSVETNGRQPTSDLTRAIRARHAESLACRWSDLKLYPAIALDDDTSNVTAATKNQQQR